MTIAVVGSRSICKEKYKKQITEIIIKMGATAIITGGAKGIDEMALEIANKEGIKIKIIRPEKHSEPWRNKVAPLERNTKIVLEANHIIAIWDGQSKGTRDVILKSQKLKKSIEIIENNLLT